MKTKYKKSEQCVFCNNNITQSKRDGLFMCITCLTDYTNKIYNILKENSKYRDKIQEVNGRTYSSYGCSNKTTVIRMLINKDKYGFVYVKIPTYKILELLELNDNTLLLEYIDAEIHIQYMCTIKKYKENAIKQIEELLYSENFKQKCLQKGVTIEEGYKRVRDQMLSMYDI